MDNGILRENVVQCAWTKNNQVMQIRLSDSRSKWQVFSVYDETKNRNDITEFANSYNSVCKKVKNL